MTEDYRDHLTAAREHAQENVSLDLVEGALMWAAVSALCSIADSLKRSEPTGVAKRLLRLEPTVEVANGAPDPTTMPDVYVDREGLEWTRRGGTSWGAYCLPGVTGGVSLAYLREKDAKAAAKDAKAARAEADGDSPESWIDARGVVWERGYPRGTDVRPMYRLAGVKSEDWFSLTYLQEAYGQREGVNS